MTDRRHAAAIIAGIEYGKESGKAQRRKIGKGKALRKGGGGRKGLTWKCKKQIRKKKVNCFRVSSIPTWFREPALGEKKTECLHTDSV